MIYSASRRTDMPAFHPDAIAGRVARSRKLEGLVLWTKDVTNCVRHPGLARAIEKAPTVIQLTVTGLAGSVWEPGAPELSTQLPELRELAARLPAGAVRWRFDPIMPGPDLHDRFRSVKARLESALGGLDAVTVSFPDPYRRAVVRAKARGLAWPVIPAAQRPAILAMMAREFSGAAGDGDYRPVRLCCEPELLKLPGVGRAQCIDGGLFERLYGLPLGDLPKDAGQRVACGCVKSTDIGEYDMPCGHGCVYCYAEN